MKNLDDNKVELCECGSLNHIFVWRYDESDNTLIFMTRLNKFGFLKRIKQSFKYLFGNVSNYGDYDELLLNPNQIEDMKRYLSIINIHANYKDIWDHGIDCFGDSKKFIEYLKSEPEICEGEKVIDQSPQIINNEIGRIEHGIL